MTKVTSAQGKVFEQADYEILQTWDKGPARLADFLDACATLDGVNLRDLLYVPHTPSTVSLRVNQALRSLMELAAAKFTTCYRKPDFVVNGTEDENRPAQEVPYMKRWYVLPRNAMCNVYLHEFLRSDDARALHDHPWRSLSFVLSGQAFEHYKEGKEEKSRHVKAGDVIYRGLDWTHRIELVESPSTGKLSSMVTLFITGPVKRPWGFHCPGGWVSSSDFHATGCGAKA